MNKTVFVADCADYDEARLIELFRQSLSALGVSSEFFAGKRVAIKPNLVSPYPPERAVTTHPSLIFAAASVIKDLGGEVVIAESPAGLYTESALKAIYNATGASDAANCAGVSLNYDLSYRVMPVPNGHVSKMFEVIAPILDCDVVVNLAKLKTHTLTGISGAAKNLFGVVPGLLKPEQHARFSDQANFMRGLCDLAAAISEKPSLHILDAVIGMEGNGPSGGRPRHIGKLLASKNPFACDLAAANIIGQRDALMLKTAAEWGLCPSDYNELDIVGGECTPISDYLAPDSDLKKWFDYIPKFLRPHPSINAAKCRGCGKCAEVCPAKMIKLADAGGKRTAVIDRSGCIRCFCCQELCPFQAVDVKKFWIFKVIQ